METIYQNYTGLHCALTPRLLYICLTMHLTPPHPPPPHTKTTHIQNNKQTNPPKINNLKDKNISGSLMRFDLLILRSVGANTTTYHQYNALCG